jgi:hypothetical protein
MTLLPAARRSFTSPVMARVRRGWGSLPWTAAFLRAKSFPIEPTAEDGTGKQRAIPEPVTDFLGLSSDKRWLIATAPVQGEEDRTGAGGRLAPSNDPAVYAYAVATTHSNIYRIPIL